MRSKNKKKIWFKRKIFGWGWYPATWQGWLITLGYLIIIIAFVTGVGEDFIVQSPGLFFLFLLVMIISLIRICYAYGEEPRWQWGKRK